MLTSEKGEKIGESKKAAREGIAMVTLSRVLMAAPGTTVLQIALKCKTNIKLYLFVTCIHGLHTGIHLFLKWLPVFV